MDIELFLRGLVVGYVVAAPVGPVNLLCIHRTLQYGRFNGFMTGLGGAVADGLFCIVAAFGLTAVSNFLFSHDIWLRLVGGAFLLGLGIKTFFSQPRPPGREMKSVEGNLVHAVGGAFLLTITNPVTILGFAAVFASIGLARKGGSMADATLATLAVFVGSCLWWATLSWLIGCLRGRIREGGLRIINRISGAAITLFGIGTLGSLLLR